MTPHVRHIRRVAYSNVIATIALLVMLFQQCNVQVKHDKRITNLENKTK